MPCAYRELLGIDCPFCGGQRSVLLLLQGRFRESFLLFPALLPLAVTPLFIRRKRTLRVMLWLDLAVVTGSWLIRLFLN
ncbi:MAG: DUF2752 domain-containing protein [Rikenellaceae bacterium]|nr:DUF2752 domain-containing protein [Rikenellaceae bacterium]